MLWREEGLENSNVWSGALAEVSVFEKWLIKEYHKYKIGSVIFY